MLKLELQDLTCPLCKTAFTATVITGAPAAMRRTTEFRTIYEGGALVHMHLPVMCVGCGYAAVGREGFGADREVSEHARELAWNIPWARQYPVERFYHAVKCAEWDDVQPYRLGNIALTAAWCAVEEGDVESERWFRRRAVVHFDAALKAGYDGVPQEQRSVVAYTLGEQYRRLGDTTLSDEWFTFAENDTSTDEKHSWVIVWANRQRTNPLEFF